MDGEEASVVLREPAAAEELEMTAKAEQERNIEEELQQPNIELSLEAEEEEMVVDEAGEAAEDEPTFDGEKSEQLDVEEKEESSELSIGLSVASVDMKLGIHAGEWRNSEERKESEREESEERVEDEENDEAESSSKAEESEDVRETEEGETPSPSSPSASEIERAESETGVPRPNVIWRADNSSDHCSQCCRFFTLFVRRHHCRTCGWIFCDACSSRRAQLPPAFLQNHSEAVVADEDSPPERVCDACYDYFENGMVRVERPLPRDVPERLLNIFLPAIGGYGDVMPMIVLAKELKARGHTVCVGSDATRRADVEGLGLEFRLIEGSLHESLAMSNRLISSTPGLLSGAAVQELLKPLVEVWTEKLEEVIEECDFDLWILNSVSSVVAFSSLQQLVPDMPIVVSTLAPTCPTRYFAPPALAGDAYSWFQFFNKLKWSITLSVSWGVYQELLEPVRERLGLPAFHKPIQELLEEMKVPQMCHWSPALLAKPSDWGSHISVSGCLPVYDDGSFRPDKELQHFLDDGKPPVYIGFGEMPHVLDEESITKLFTTCLKAAFECGERVIVNKSGWDSSKVFPVIELVQDQVHYVDWVPHAWLLRRCAAAVVHGGVGTVHSALAAACVPIVVAFAGDQPFWGDLLARKGYAPARFMADGLKQKALAKAIRTAVSDEEMRLKVKSNGALQRREKGRQWAVEFLERHSTDEPNWSAAWPPDQAMRSKVDLFEDP
mmetsp:Transcript_17951/g.69526  ORF Transcript_17951/g.69526 Transcript_17951/m.69526 type:complete len:726 (+) Transcript_17951:113-2290(+)